MDEQHIGVKFKVIHLPAEEADDPRIEELIRIGKELAARGFCPKNCGNMSFRVPDGFVITPVRASLGDLKPKDFVLVKDVDIGKKKVFVAGKAEPSSEAMMHFLIYGARPEISVIFHGHALDLPNAVTTKKSYPYGTLESARSAVEVLKDRDLVILKDHGFVAVGKTAAEVFQRVQ